MKQQTYSANLTGDPFLFLESKIVAKYLLEDQSSDHIINVVVKENLFCYKTPRSILKRVNTVLKRLSFLDKPLLEILVNSRNEIAKIINLFSIIHRKMLLEKCLAGFR